MKKLFEYLIVGTGGIVIIIVFSVYFAFPLMWCWNYIMPSLFGLKTINWLGAWCLSFIANCLIKSTNTITKS